VHNPGQTNLGQTNPSQTNLGETRSSNQRDHVLLTPDTFVRTVLPGMKKGTAIVHISAARGAAFAEYTAELEQGGELGDTPAQRFLVRSPLNQEVSSTRSPSVDTLIFLAAQCIA
jgi:glyoxylate utilization-related uncharacterized protein